MMKFFHYHSKKRWWFTVILMFTWMFLKFHLRCQVWTNWILRLNILSWALSKREIMKCLLKPLSFTVLKIGQCLIWKIMIILPKNVRWRLQDYPSDFNDLFRFSIFKSASKLDFLLNKPLFICNWFNLLATYVRMSHFLIIFNHFWPFPLKSSIKPST